MRCRKRWETLVVLSLVGCAAPAPRQTPAPVPAPAKIETGTRFSIAAAGDIAGRRYAQDVTASLLRQLLARDGLRAILPLGDTVYPRGDLADYLRYYAPSWGTPELLAITRPVPGNHEYDQGESDADGYFDYFLGVGRDTGPAGTRGLGYYSYDIGDWHFVALNTSDGCRKISCRRGSPMHDWLVADLAATKKRCVLAYFHHPRFQHGSVHGEYTAVGPLWQALYDAGADVVLSGHEHVFQQLAPLDPRGERDDARGIRSFVVGTGGARPYVATPKRGRADPVEKRERGVVGVLQMWLEPAAYEWRFWAVGEGATAAEVVVEGRDSCH